MTQEAILWKNRFKPLNCVSKMRTYEEADPGGDERGNPSRIHAKSLTRDLKKKTNGSGAGRAIEMEMPIVPTSEGQIRINPFKCFYYSVT